MNGILLTQNSTFIIGQVAWLLGKIMEGIFEVLNMIGIPNIGLAIILFTIVVNLLMMPLTIKQQKFSKLSAKMNPEIQAIQAKYKNRKVRMHSWHRIRKFRQFMPSMEYLLQAAVCIC